MKRIILISKLILFPRDFKSLRNELSKYPWDYEKDPFKLEKHHISDILYRYIKDDLTSSEIEDWANFIECREDIDYSDFQTTIDELANPLLHSELSKENAEAIITRLENNN